MAKIVLLDSDGKPEKTKDGQDKFMYSVDGRGLVARGLLMEVRETHNINGTKKSVVVAYRPITQQDKNAVRKAKKAQVAKLAAELAAEETAESAAAAKAKAVDSANKTEEDTEDLAELAFEADLEDVEEEVPVKKATGRTRPARKVK